MLWACCGHAVLTSCRIASCHMPSLALYSFTRCCDVFTAAFTVRGDVSRSNACKAPPHSRYNTVVSASYGTHGNPNIATGRQQ